MREIWRQVALQDACERVTVGHVGKTSAYYCDEGIIFLRTQNVGRDGLKLDNVKFITPEFHRALKKSQLVAGDVLISRVVTDDMRCAIVPRGLGPSNCANIILLRPGPRLNSQYLYYLVNSPYAQQYLLDRRVGSAQQVVNTKVLKDWKIPVPSVREQERIVAILDEAFAEIAAAVANTEKNIVNARELFESYLHKLFNKAYSECKIVPLSDLASDITDGDHMPPPKSTTGVPFITIKNIDKRSRKIDFDNTFMVSQDYFEGLKKNRRPKKGDVLYTVTASYGIPVVVDCDRPFCFQRHIGLIRPSDRLYSKWLYYLLLAPQIKSQAGSQATGTAQKTVSLKALRGFQVPQASLEDQRDNVVVLNEINAETHRLESIYQQKLTALAELKQSLLQKAFSGELTADKEASGATLKEEEVS